jgi:plasmid maintenance system antidote protein VapI
MMGSLGTQSGWGPAIPPGEVLFEEFLKPLGIGQTEAARRLGISLNRLNKIVLGSPVTVIRAISHCAWAVMVR